MKYNNIPPIIHGYVDEHTSDKELSHKMKHPVPTNEMCHNVLNEIPTDILRTIFYSLEVLFRLC